MAADYYPQPDDTGSDASSPAPDDQAQDQSSQDQGESGLLPKTFFPDGVKAGDQCTIEVMSCHQDDCEVKYVSKTDDEGSEDDETAEAPEPGTMEASQAKLASMAT